MDELDKHISYESLWKILAQQKEYCSRNILKRRISYQERNQPTTYPDEEEHRIRKLFNEAYIEAKENAYYIRLNEWKNIQKKEKINCTQLENFD